MPLSPVVIGHPFRSRATERRKATAAVAKYEKQVVNRFLDETDVSSEDACLLPTDGPFLAGDLVATVTPRVQSQFKVRFSNAESLVGEQWIQLRQLAVLGFVPELGGRDARYAIRGGFTNPVLLGLVLRS